MSDINPGDAVRLSTVFTNAAGTATDPTTVTLRVRAEGATATVYTYGGTIVKDSVGNYHLDYVVPAITPHRALTFHFQWEGTGAVQAFEPGVFVVRDPYTA